MVNSVLTHQHQEFLIDRSAPQEIKITFLEHPVLSPLVDYSMYIREDNLNRESICQIFLNDRHRRWDSYKFLEKGLLCIKEVFAVPPVGRTENEQNIFLEGFRKKFESLPADLISSHITNRLYADMKLSIYSHYLRDPKKLERLISRDFFSLHTIVNQLLSTHSTIEVSYFFVSDLERDEDADPNLNTFYLKKCKQFSELLAPAFQIPQETFEGQMVARRHWKTNGRLIKLF